MRMQDEGGEASSGLFSGPAAQRASSATPHTRPHPFRLSASNTPAVHAAALTTDQRQLMELKARKREEAAHRRRQLARLVTAPAAYGGGHGGGGAAAHGSPQRAPTKVKPFNLMSVALHEQEVAAREAALRVRLLLLAACCLRLWCRRRTGASLADCTANAAFKLRSARVWAACRASVPSGKLAQISLLYVFL